MGSKSVTSFRTFAFFAAAVSVPGGGSAQDWTERLPPPQLQSALIRDGDAWRFSTSLDALRVLREPPPPGRWWPESDPAVAELVQRSRAALDALTDPWRR